MSIPFVTFRPADYHKGKESYIAFHVTDPQTCRLVRRKVKLNHIKNAREREKYAKLLCHQINEKLYAGWNPLLERVTAQAVTAKQAVAKFLSVKKRETRPDTMRTYRSSAGLLLSWLEEYKIADKYLMLIEKQHLIRYLEQSTQNNTSNRTWNNKAAFLSLLFDWFVKRGYISTNPASGLPRLRVDEKRRGIIPKEDRKRIAEYFDSCCPNYNSAMQLCFRLFVRPKEICGLRIRDIDFDNQILRIPPELAKNHRERLLGIPDPLFDYFKTLAAVNPSYYIYGNASDYSPSPKRISPSRIGEKWKEMRDKLKLPASYQFYSLKDTGITEMLEAGVPAKYVKELADHHSLEMTERYTHRSEAKKILEWNRLEF